MKGVSKNVFKVFLMADTVSKTSLLKTSIIYFVFFNEHY